MKIGFKLMLISMLIAAVLLTEVDCGKKNKKEVKSKKGKENRGGHEKKFAYNESPKIKERKLKFKSNKKSPSPAASEEILSGKKAGKLSSGLKVKPTAPATPTITEKIIEQIVQEEIVIEEELPVEEFEEAVVVEEETLEDSATVEEEETAEETLDEVAPEANETAEGDETLEEPEVEVLPVRATPAAKAHKVKRKVAPVVEEVEPSDEIEPVVEAVTRHVESSKSGGKRPKKVAGSSKQKKTATKKVKAQKSKRKTEL